MTCLRCGYCCTHYAIVIVVDPKQGPVDGNLRAIDASKERCPHLRKQVNGRYCCAIHDQPWFPETPCGQHGQISANPDDPCRIGRHVARFNAR